MLKASSSLPNHTRYRSQKAYGYPSRLSRRLLTPVASVTVRDEACGVDFNLAQKFWVSDTTFRCLGAGTRVKKILFVPVQVYSVALYVEAQKAANELGIRDRGGFFENDEDYCTAVVDGAFDKVLMLHMLRDIDGTTLTEALEQYLKPRLQLAGELDKLGQFGAFFNDKKLSKDLRVVLLWRVAAKDELTGVDVVLIPPEQVKTGVVETLKPQLTIQSGTFGRALFETFLGSNSAVPDVKKEWVVGAKKLLESEIVARGTHKSGSG